MDCGMSIVKFFIFLFNLIFALGALALVVLGALILSKLKFITDILEEAKVSAPAIVLIVVGSVIFIIAFLGCCGAAKESHCMLISYAVVLSAIFIVEIVIGALAFVYHDEVEKAAEKAMDKVFDDYRTNDEERSIVDNLQSTFECCGVESPFYWAGIMPSSCCEGKPSICINPYKRGCLPVVKDWIKWSGNILGGVAIGVAAIEVLGIIFSCCLANTIRNEDRRRGFH